MAVRLKFVPRPLSGAVVANLAGTLRSGPGRTKGVLSLDIPTDVQLAGVARDGPGRVRGQLYTTTGAQPAFIFISDWANATLGKSIEAKRDQNRWTGVGSSGAIANGTIIVNPGNIDFPSGMARVFLVDAVIPNVGDAAVQPYVTTLPIPGIGTSRYYRWYFRWGSQTPDWCLSFKATDSKILMASSRCSTCSMSSWSFP